MIRQAGLSSVKLLLFFSAICFFISCETDSAVTKRAKPKKIEIPPLSFNEDSAYYFIEKQVGFGPRVPNTSSHSKCADWLFSYLSRHADKTLMQKAEVLAYNGEVLKMKNIIASFNPDAKKRIFLCAHWDTRPFADQDTENKDQPIPGANDGGSGVGVLLEVARQINLDSLKIGIDIILFDTEDYGAPRNSPQANKQDTWCLGSQYWSKRPHISGYNAKYGILLDMVGAKDARFSMEKNSMIYASSVMKRMWKLGHQLGHGSFFSYDKASPIVDDHLYINKIANLPCIDVVHYATYSNSGFGSFWHTHDDNMDVIDKGVLKAVGETVLAMIKTENLN